MDNFERMAQNTLKKYDDDLKNDLIVSKSELIRPNLLESQENRLNYDTKIRVLGQDLREQIFNSDYNNNKIGIMNFASATNPGGGFLNGAVAQEETICRSSYLYPELIKIKEFYQINTEERNHGLYTSILINSINVNFIANQNDKFVNHEKQRNVDIITTAAPNVRSIKFKSKKFDKKVKNALLTRMRATLRLMKSNQDEIIILGAFGCGVFGNSPYQVAEIWKELLISNEFNNQFKVVIMAMGNKGTNYQVFRNIIKSFL